MVDRYDALREVAKAQDVDAIALVPGANFARLFNKEFHQNERPLVVVIPAQGKPAAIVPNLELASFAALSFEGNVYDWKDQTGYQQAFDALLQQHPINSLGVEGQVMRVFVDQAFRQGAPALKIIDAQRAIASLRICKNSEEIAAIRNAIHISETALANTIDKISIGMSEKAIESLLVQQLFAAGAEDFAFPPIVAANTNSAQPHAHSRADYKVQAGDALLIDFGARAGGVCADITRTFFVDHCSDHSAEVYNTVLAANLAGIASARPDVTAHDVDDATTAVLEQSPFADRIRHKTGHGLGRDIHEDPYIMRGNNEPLHPGMVFTIEPGLYELSDFGVRIEDDVLITETGCEVMTTFDKNLTIIA
ncbi:Xaa-Pro peptidase family protein [bacterium]|nr:Xaa-Pro peptidase family protein [bacterium]